MSVLIDWANKNRKSAATIIIVFIFIFISIIIWYRSEGIIFVSSSALDSNEKTLDDAILQNAKDLQNWYRANIIIQSVLILAGLSATISAASTNKENTEILKKYTVTLTAITSTLAIVLTTFHIRENIETFIRANADLSMIEMDYLQDRASKPIEAVLRARAKEAEHTKVGVKAVSSNGEADPPELLAVWAKYEQRYLDVEAARMHAWASVGQQSLASSSPPSQANKAKPAFLTEEKVPEGGQSQPHQ